MKLKKKTLVKIKDVLLKLGNVADTKFSTRILESIREIDKVMKENDVELSAEMSKYLQDRDRLRDINEKHTFMKKNASMEKEFNKLVAEDAEREVEADLYQIEILPSNLTAMQLDYIDGINKALV